MNSYRYFQDAESRKLNHKQQLLHLAPCTATTATIYIKKVNEKSDEVIRTDVAKKETFHKS